MEDYRSRRVCSVHWQLAGLFEGYWAGDVGRALGEGLGKVVFEL
jgi:hypothetical protein